MSALTSSYFRNNKRWQAFTRPSHSIWLSFPELNYGRVYTGQANTMLCSVKGLSICGIWCFQGSGPQKPPEEDTYSQHPTKYIFTSPFPPISNSLSG